MSKNQPVFGGAGTELAPCPSQKHFSVLQHNQSIQKEQSPGFSRFITAVFDGWSNAGIDFLVLRNYEGLPQKTTNDIDVLVAKHQLTLAEQTLILLAAHEGYSLVNRTEFVPVSLHFADLQTADQVHFDLFVDMRWHSFEFIRCNDFLNRKIQRGNFWIPHPADEACTNLLGYLVYRGRVRDKYKRSIVAAFRIYANAARALLTESYGEELAQKLVRLAIQEKWSDIEAMTRKLRAALLVRLVTRRPLKTLAVITTDTARFARRVLRPAGLMVVLLGPDGCGKTTIAKAIFAGLAATFYSAKSVHYHWKPKLLPRKAKNAQSVVTNPHGRPPRNPVFSLVFFGLHWAEFVLGSILKIWPVLFRGGLVLIERYYHDFFVDQARYRLRVPKVLAWLGYLFVKKPDLVLLLDASVDVLRTRKQEVSTSETERQRNAYLELAAKTKNAVVINAAQQPEHVAADAIKAILTCLAARAQRRTEQQTGNTTTQETHCHVTEIAQHNQLDRADQ